jgi:hypothetical protein
MTHTARTPVWLRIAAAAMVAQDLTAFILYPITALSAVLLGVTVLLAWLLLRGSRVAWMLSVFSAATQLIAPLTMNQPIWFAGVAAVLLACLLAPPSRAFVWERQERTGGSWRSTAQQMYGKFLTFIYGLIARVPWPGEGSANEEGTVDRPGHGKLIGLLVICVVILVPLDNALHNFHQGSGSGSVIVDVLWRVVSVGDGLAQLALIALLVMAAYRYVTRRYGGSSHRAPDLNKPQ